MRIGLLIGMLTISSIVGAGPANAERAASLRGSPASMQEQNRVARDHGVAFYRTAAEIREAALKGDLVELRGNEDYAVADFVNLPYLRPEAALFVERLAAQYREACGQKLVVTSAVRPSNAQPSNAHALSVHPAGLAVDLRVSDRAACRSWLESSILGLERAGVLNGIREFHPPHYHIAVYPSQYLAYAEARMHEEAAVLAASAAVEDDETSLAAFGETASGYHASAVGDGDAEGGVPAPRIALVLFAAGVPFGLGLFLRRRTR